MIIKPRARGLALITRTIDPISRHCTTSSLVAAVKVGLGGGTAQVVVVVVLITIQAGRIISRPMGSRI